MPGAPSEKLLLSAICYLPEKSYDLLKGRRSGKHPSYTQNFQLLDIALRDVAADDDLHVLKPLVPQPGHDPLSQRQVRPGEDGEADDVYVLLQGCLDDLIHRLVQPGVDHLEARVAQGQGDHLGPPVVPVQAGLGDQDTDWFF
jgi:hypothetical protein